MLNLYHANFLALYTRIGTFIVLNNSSTVDRRDQESQVIFCDFIVLSVGVLRFEGFLLGWIGWCSWLSEQLFQMILNTT